MGRGVCSSVWKARRKQKQQAALSSSVLQNGEQAANESNALANNNDIITHYALKVFPLRDPTRRTMLIRELKLLCSFHCDCLVELEGAFMDNDNDDEGSSGSGDCTVTLVLEFMDRGSLDDFFLTGGNEDGIDVDVSAQQSPNENG